MSNLKPGDPALTLVDLDEVPVMSCVEVVEIHIAGKPVRIKGQIKIFKQDYYVADYEGKLYGYAIKSLMPLRGDAQPEHQRSREVIE
ncbi:MAG: hypothetical protein RR740_08980 [Pseudomonas sp.]